jgi:hypothetical protein
MRYLALVVSQQYNVRLSWQSFIEAQASGRTGMRTMQDCRDSCRETLACPTRQTESFSTFTTVAPTVRTFRSRFHTE